MSIAHILEYQVKHSKQSVPSLPTYVRTHTCTHICTHTHTHARTHAHIHIMITRTVQYPFHYASDTMMHTCKEWGNVFAASCDFSRWGTIFSFTRRLTGVRWRSTRWTDPAVWGLLCRWWKEPWNIANSLFTAVLLLQSKDKPNTFNLSSATSLMLEWKTTDSTHTYTYSTHTHLLYTHILLPYSTHTYTYCTVHTDTPTVHTHTTTVHTHTYIHLCVHTYVCIRKYVPYKVCTVQAYVLSVWITSVHLYIRTYSASEFDAHVYVHSYVRRYSLWLTVCNVLLIVCIVYLCSWEHISYVRMYKYCTHTYTYCTHTYTYCTNTYT